MRYRIEQLAACLVALACCVLLAANARAQGIWVSDDTGETRIAHVYNDAGTLLHFATDEVNGRYLATDEQLAMGDYDGDGDSDGPGIDDGTFLWVDNGHATSVATTEYPRWSGTIEMRDGAEVTASSLAAEIGAIETGGETQSRINRKPAPAFTFKVSRRADGTYECTSKLRIVPGSVETLYPAIDMSPLFGPNINVRTVGTPAISGGSITVAAEGPHDTYAYIEVDGTATASEERTITVPVTMDTNETVQVKLYVEVFGS
jgi:hypothetical protein